LTLEREIYPTNDSNKKLMDFLQISGNQPLGTGSNPTKFGVNWPSFSKTILRNSDFSKNSNNGDLPQILLD
jgi:hypothetical protein